MKYLLQNQIENQTYKVFDTFIKEGMLVLKNAKLLSLEGTKLNINLTHNENILIEKLFVKKGDEVKNGDLLFTFSEVLGEIKYLKDMPKVVKVLAVNQNKPDESILTLEGGKLNFNLKLETDETLEKIFVKVGDEVTDKTPLYSVLKSDLKPKTYDLIVIGSGPGGYVGAIYAAKKGLKTCLIEKEYLGGTCLNVGCIPTKVLFETSANLEKLNSLKALGINIDTFNLDFSTLVKRKGEVITNLSNGVKELLNKNGVDLCLGTGIIKNKNEVLVEEKVLNTKYILIATGSKHAKVNIPGAEYCLNSTSLLSIKHVPKSLVIIGGGVVGMEFGFIFNGLGANVTILEYAPFTLNNHDEDVSAAIENVAKEKNINILTSAKVEKIEKEQGKLKITYVKDNKRFSIFGDECLMSIGREANLTGVTQYKEIKILSQKEGIFTDKYFKTSVDNIYAIGDCINTMPLAHVASFEAKAAIDNMLGDKKTLNYDYVPFTSFTNPEVSGVGIFEREAKKRKINYKVVKYFFKDNGKSYIENATSGFIKLTFDIDNDCIIGAQIVGTHGDTLLNAIVSAIKNKEKSKSLVEQIFAHPTVGESLNEAYLDILGLSIHKHE